MQTPIVKNYDKKTHKKCIKCRQWKPRDGKFGKHDTSSDGLQSICSDCKNKANIESRNKNVTARIRHHMSTRCMTQLGEYAPEGFIKDMEKYLGYRITTLVKHLKEDLAKREPDKKLRDALNEGYHIDHIKPLSLFPVIRKYGTASGEPEVDWEEFQLCWAMKNLSAIPAAENLAKGAKYDENDEDEKDSLDDVNSVGNVSNET